MKKLSFITICTALSILPMMSALAAWQELGYNELMSVSVDVDTLQRSGDKAQIMSMLNFKKPGENKQTKEPVNSIIGLNEFNCSNATYRPIEFKEFGGKNGGGKLVSTNPTPDSPYEAVPQNSWQAGVFNVACRKK